MKKIISAILAVLLISACVALCACGTPAGTEKPASKTNEASEPVKTTPENTKNTPASETGNGDSGESNDDSSLAVLAKIALSSSGAQIDGQGAAYADGVVTVTTSGAYEITGSSDNCSIVVSVDKSEKVELILAGVSITNPTGPAIWCDSADKLLVTAKEGTKNTLKDSANYKDPNGPNAALYSDDDMTVRGPGALTVIGLYKNGISSKNDVKITGDIQLTVEAYNTGIRGKDSVNVVSGTLKITAGNDGLKATAEDKPGKGVVTVEGGEIAITAGDDGIQAATVITVSGGSFNITAGDKKTNAPTVNVENATGL